MAYDPQLDSHKEWLAYLRPFTTGLVVSPTALRDAQIGLDRRAGPELEARLAPLLDDEHRVRSFRDFALGFLRWPPELLLTGAAAGLEVQVTAYNETLRPTWALRDPQGENFTLLVEDLATATDFDQPTSFGPRSWNASPQARFERLLRDSKVHAGLLWNGAALRLVYAPKDQTTGHITFPFRFLQGVPGRPLLTALYALLGYDNLIAGPSSQRLPALLKASRESQAAVSERLADQVVEALHELLRGFQAADDRLHGALLRGALASDPQQIYHGLLTVLLRIVFILFAEDRGLLASGEPYARHYSITALHASLREDDALHPETMDLRFGAWARLLVVFNLIYAGSRHSALELPARQGDLFDPAKYPFLSGAGGDIPPISDGVVLRALNKLLILDGERLSYRGLDVEQIGSVYEAAMGFRLERATGRSIALRSSGSAPVAINLETLLASPPAQREKWLASEADCSLVPKAAQKLRAAQTEEQLLTALDSRIARSATPAPVPAGGLLLQPSPERRRSGSHYTPRALTEPIVEAALGPVLARLGPRPRAAQILALKICDPACGSGAFLVEAGRQLATELAAAWARYGETPPLDADQDALLHARRVLAQSCLYGVDRNPLAVELAKLSLWLATLAKDHPFTFLDHSIRAGDSLLGLSRAQIERFNLEPAAKAKPLAILQQRLESKVELALAHRRRILAAADAKPYPQLVQELGRADDALAWPRLAADCILAAFFSSAAPARREAERQRLESALLAGMDSPNDWPTLDAAVATARAHGLRPFHWELEFPEVFAPENPGFDAIVGNPPFAGKNTLLASNPANYLDWLKALHPESSGNSDLAAHFFRRAFTLLKPGGCFGLIATNTISQGDTRSTGLRWLCTHGGAIYRADRRFVWPGQAAVVVSIVHMSKGPAPVPCLLDGRPVPRITAFLFHAGASEDPKPLAANAEKSFIGTYILGLGFTFDDSKPNSPASPLAEMHRLIAKDPRNQERIFPYLGGDEVNTSPTHAFHRYVINFEDFPLRRTDLGQSWFKADDRHRAAWLRQGTVPADYPAPVAADWPDLLAIVEARVKPERDRLGSGVDAERRKRLWWRYGRETPALNASLRGQSHALVTSRVSESFAFALLPAGAIFSDSLVVIPRPSWPLFAVLQSRPHELWASFYGSTMKSDPRYTPTDCFETFPFPASLDSNAALAALGREYHELRAGIMQSRNEGLTSIYNRFHNPAEKSPDIVRLRELHAALDAAALAAWGWSVLAPRCDFLPSPDGSPRLRWPDELHDEVLGRLLALNAERFAAELASPPSRARKPKTRAAAADQPSLPELQ